MLIFICAYAVNAHGQAFSEADRGIIEKKEFKSKKFKERKITFGFGKGRVIPNIVFAPPLYFYQKFISTQISASCLFHPTCSEFSKQAFIHYSIPKAFFCSVDRVMRCDRLSASDIPEIMVDLNDFTKHEGIDYYGKIK